MNENMTNHPSNNLVHPISKNLFQYRSTCYVYILRSGSSAVLVDYGDGSVLDVLPGLGIEHVDRILITHHHRDQVQGLPLAEAQGIQIWVPSVERELFEEVEAHWQARPVFNNYNMRQDRNSLLYPVSVSGLLEDYARYSMGGYDFEVLPAPGHTPGSIVLLSAVDGKRVAFSGDLIAGPGKVWSMAATQWSYNGAEGAAYSALSLYQLGEKPLDLLLPSHGQVMEDPQCAMDLLIRRLRALLDARNENTRMLRFLREPFEQLTPHLLINWTSQAHSYVLRSESGKALLVDFGYDFIGGVTPGTDRAGRRPWLYNLPVLKRDFGVSRVDVVIPTHFHDDHVAGINLLRRVEGTSLWAPENFAPILENPAAYDLPCLWYDSIPAERILPLSQPIAWEEYTLWLYEFPGHTRYAAAIFVEVDGQRVLFTGDEYQGESGVKWNYVYQNHFQITDYREAAALYQHLAPDLILSGHWEPQTGSPAYFQRLCEDAEVLEQIHRDLLQLEHLDLGAEDAALRINPYQVTTSPGGRIAYQARVVNPFQEEASACLRFIVPSGWQVDPVSTLQALKPGEEGQFHFVVHLPEGAVPARRVRLGIDLTIGSRRLGQQAECLVDVLERDPCT